MESVFQEGDLLVRPFIALGVAVLVGLAAHAILFAVLRRFARSAAEHLPMRGALLRGTRRPLRLLFPLVAVAFARPLIVAGLTPLAAGVLDNALYVLLILAVAWLLIAALFATERAVEERFDLDAEDNLRARRVITQTQILRRILVVLVLLLTAAGLLMHYVPGLGTGLLASAGVAGIALGFAAQKTLGNLFAGFQIAITQPIRVDDVVIVEGEFGWVEEITLTYVVVRVWDLRRIVLPISYFIEQPFQNWTRTSSELLGTVFLHLDYTVPIENIRAEHRRLVEADERWDGRACAVQVTDSSERTMEVRCLQSAASAPRLFELRCAVREHMIAFVQREYPGALPRVRAEVDEATAVQEGRSVRG